MSVWETQSAISEIIKSDDNLIAKIDEHGVFDSEIPPGVERPHRYLVLGEVPGEISSSTFGRWGKDSLLWIHIWHDGTDADGSVELGKRLPMAIVADLERLFNRTRIALDQWTMLLGEINLIRLARDPSIAYMHGIVQYRFSAKAPVAQ